jgi:hypothetical protein
VQAIVEALGITVAACEHPPASRAEQPFQPLSFTAYDREIVALWVADRSRALPLLRVIEGLDRPSGGLLRRRDGCRIASARLDGSLRRALASAADLVLVDAGGAELNLDDWRRLAVERERGVSVILLTTSAMDAYRCDRVALAMWSLPDLLSSLESLARDMHPRTRELVAGTSPPRRAAALAADLLRENRAARDLIAHAKRRAWSTVDRVRLAELSSQAAGAMLDERMLETFVAEAEAL